MQAFFALVKSNPNLAGRPYRKYTKEVFGITSETESSQEIVDPVSRRVKE